MSRRSTAAFMLLFGAAWVLGGCVRQGNAPAGSPPRPEADARPFSVLEAERFYQRWLAAPELQELSTEPTSAADRFTVAVRTDSDPGSRASGGGRPFGLLVGRDGAATAALFTAGDGTPYAFMNHKFMVMLDPAGPGKIITARAFDQSGMDVQITGRLDTTLVRARWIDAAGLPSVRVNLRALVPPAELAEGLEFDPRRLVAVIKAANGSWSIELDPDHKWDARYAIKAVSARLADGRQIRVEAQVGMPPPRDLMTVTFDDVRRLHLPEGRPPDVLRFDPPAHVAEPANTPAVRGFAVLFPSVNR